MTAEITTDSTWVQMRQRLGGTLIKGALTGLAYAARISPHFWKDRSLFNKQKDVFYTEHKDHNRSLDIYTPTVGTGPYPTVFFIHGGGFRICSKDTHWMMAHTLARKGYLVVSINYRLVPHVRFPIPCQDVCDAFLWTVNHAESIEADLTQLFLMGESAGANLSTMLALALSNDRPEEWTKSVRSTGVKPIGLIPQCGLLQVHEIERYESLDVPTWIADRIQRVALDYLGSPTPELSALASPLKVIADGDFDPKALPPVFAPVGDRDPIIDDTIKLDEALNRQGVIASAPVYPGGHAFHAMGTRAAKQCWRDTLRFMKSCLDDR